MNYLQFIPISCLLLILVVTGTQSTYLCDMQAIDNVFNIGHLIYMTRCGEVWTFDPRMNEKGGFIRDYSWFSFARRFFGSHVFQATQDKEVNKYLHFAAFSFQEINCVRESENIHKDCSGSVRAWNGLSVMVDNLTAHTFKYDSDIEEIKDSNNPLGFGSVQSMNGSDRSKFWPEMSDVAIEYADMNLKGKGFVHSALFSRNKLYIVLRSDNGKYYCVTYMEMDQMLHDVRHWPKNNRGIWAKCQAFTGNVVGMFYHEINQQDYIVGRVAYEVRKYEDQIYQLSTGANGHSNGNGRPVLLEPQPLGVEMNLRSFFGCPKEEVTKPSNQKRRKRSVDNAIDGSPESVLNWEAIKQEVTEDWKSLSVMSLSALFLIAIIVKLSQQIHFK